MNEWHEAEEHVERAHQHYEAGRWDDAASELRKALSSNPYQVEWHFNLGLTLDAGGRFDAAADAFRQAHDLEPEDPQICVMLGVATLKAGSPEGALTWLAKAETLAQEHDQGFPARTPTDVRTAIAVHRIEALARLGRHDEAETIFYMAQGLGGDTTPPDPQHAPLLAAMADSLMDRGLHEKAIWCLREAGRLDPDLPRVHSRLAEAYAATNRHERARSLYLQELRRDPGDIEALLDLGDLLITMDRLEESSEKYRRVLEMEPDEPDAHFGLAEIAARQGRYDDSINSLQLVLKLNARHQGVRRRLAEMLVARAKDRDLAEARRLLRHEARDLRKDSASPSAPEPDAQALEDLGRLFLDVSLPAEASGVLRALLERHPDHPAGVHLLGVARFRMGDRPGGMEQARRAIELDPGNVRAMHNLAMGYLQQGQWTRARYWVGRARVLDPDDASLRRLSMRLGLWAVADVFSWVGRVLGWRRREQA